MLKLLDWLGERLLGLLRIVFVPKAARRKLGSARTGTPPATPQTHVTGDGDAAGSRQELIDRAVSLHREKQDVLAKLDDRSRRKLTAMAHRMMAPPPGGRKRR